MSARRHHTVVAGQRHLVRVFPVPPVSPSVGRERKGDISKRDGPVKYLRVDFLF